MKHCKWLKSLRFDKKIFCATIRHDGQQDVSVLTKMTTPKKDPSVEAD